jgi:hypothetical protein
LWQRQRQCGHVGCGGTRQQVGGGPTQQVTAYTSSSGAGKGCWGGCRYPTDTTTQPPASHRCLQPQPDTRDQCQALLIGRPTSQILKLRFVRDTYLWSCGVSSYPSAMCAVCVHIIIIILLIIITSGSSKGSSLFLAFLKNLTKFYRVVLCAQYPLFAR